MSADSKIISMDWNDSIEGNHEEITLFRSKRERLTDGSGRTYGAFRNGLKASYRLVWAQIAAAWAVMMLCVVALWTLHPVSGPAIFAAIPGAVIIGYCLAFLVLWFHEAAHFNIHSNRRVNDLLANLFIGPVIGLCLSAYRPIHFGHHAYLGMINDPERSYFSPLTLGFILRTLLGIHALTVLWNYTKHNSVAAARKDKEAPVNWMLPISLGLHLGISATALWTGHVVLAASWFAGAFMVFPCFGSLRQLLEHRRFEADNAADYTTMPHGAFSRIFGSGPIASTFGGAGFNRHLIHHWDPALSCTVFKDVEDFLLDSELKEFYESRQSTYGAAFRRLFAG